MRMVLRLLLLTLGSLTLFYSIHILTTDRQQANAIIAPIQRAAESQISKLPAEVKGVRTEKKETLDTVVQQSLEGTKGTYAVYFKDLKTGEVYMQNENRTYTAASLYKIWIMAVVFEQIEQGKLKEDQLLKDTVENLNKKFEIPEDVAERTEGEIELTVKDALHRMITFSDNYAALLLSSNVRLANVKTFLQKNGFDHSLLNEPRTTARDIGVFYEKLYRKELVSSSASEKMLTLLKKQELNDRIPKYLPDDVEVAHKTGELDQVKHDAGIVYAKTGDYVLVVLSESTAPLQAAERIARVSEAIYNYVSTNKK